MQDQLIIFMALSHGVSRMRTGPLSMHTQTAMHYAAFITGATFTETKAEGGTNIVECHGIGFDGVDAQLHEGKKARWEMRANDSQTHSRFEDTLPSTHKPFKFDRSKIFK
mmetsp:Transcript_17624/g.41978  ORF Transcript_17624/g.41978 Transcript_17624/m.41978 type:complete len:110 (-) Transcript_17624:26-355(-)